MSIIEEKLKQLTPGMTVRLTQANGVTYEGIVKQNDGSESVEIEVYRQAVLRYDNISSVEFSAAAVPVQTPAQTKILPAQVPVKTQAPAPAAAAAPAEAKPAEPKPVVRKNVFSYDKLKEQLPKFSSGMHNFSSTFKLLDKDVRVDVNGQLSKIKAGDTAHDYDKIEQGMTELWNIVCDKKLDYDPTVNLFVAYGYYLGKMFTEAAEAFFYANDLYSAFSCMVTEAIRDNDKTYYTNAAAYAAISIVSEPKGEHIDEALKVLDVSSYESNDVSAVGFVYERTDNVIIRGSIHDILVHIAENNDIVFTDSTNISTMLSEVRKVYTASAALDIINTVYTEDIPVQEETQPALQPAEQKDKPEEKKETAVDTSKEYIGRIVQFNFFEKRGKIENEMGVQYSFESKNIVDASFRSKVDGLVNKDFEPIYVAFYISKSLNSFSAVKIRKCDTSSDIRTGISYADQLQRKAKYDEAIAEYTKHLGKDVWETAFISIMNCYLSKSKASPGKDFVPEMKKLVDKYGAKVPHTIKNLSVLHQYYMKAEEFDEAIGMLDELIASSKETEYNRILYCISEKARCYRGLKYYSEAIDQYEYWIKLVNEKKYSSLYLSRDTYIYPELASLYYQAEDYDNAEKYILLSQSKEKKAMLQDIERIRAEQKEQLKAGDEDSYEEDVLDEDPDETDDYASDEIFDFGDLSALTAEYHDPADFSALGLTDTDILGKAFDVPRDKLYCLITYLTAAAYAARDSEYAETLASAEYCVRAASGHLRSAEDLNSSTLTYRFGIFKETEPEKYEIMFASAALRALFEQNESPDDEADMLMDYLSGMKFAKEFPAVMQLAEHLSDFRKQTGCGVSEFADYKTDTAAMERIRNSAVKCRESIDARLEVYEGKGRLRRTRQMLFADPEGVLRSALNTACDNDTSDLEGLKEELSALFIKKGRPFEYSSIDRSKIDSFVNAAWDKARDMMLAEGRKVNRPYERLIDPKRRTVIETVDRVLKCVFDWLAAAERKADSSKQHAKFTYASIRDTLIAYLKEIRSSTKKDLEAGFNWETDFLRGTAKELLAKLQGTYDERKKKYLYIDFLRTDNILLDDNYQPEVYATFLGRSDFNILRRIEKHMSAELPEITDRIDDLFCNDISKNNLRSAGLLRSYADDMGIEEISGHNMYNYFDKCVSMGRSKLKDLNEDFLSQLELYQSYGALSDINGEKTEMEKECDVFFKICFTSCDFGFFAGLINVYNATIEANSEETADILTRQLDELELNPRYDWGIYSKDEIKAFIADRNFSIAENLMNCIRRSDTKEVADYSIESLGYLSVFLDEYPTNYKAVCDFSLTLEGSVKKYTSKNDIEVAITRMMHNARKDSKGGAALIKNWIPQAPTTASVEKLMGLLGFANLTVVKESGTADESFLISRARQPGRVSYHYPLPAFSSVLEQEGARAVCLYGKYDAERLIDKFKEINTTSKHTVVFLDYALKLPERKHFARKLKEEKGFSKTFILIDRVVLYYLALHFQSNTVDKMLMSVTMPFAYYQPFSATNKLGRMSPELYTGRQAELASIEDPNGCNLVYGGRQLGKSVLLGMAERHVDGNANGDRALVVDICAKDYNEAARTVSEKLVDRHILPEGSETDDWDILVRHISKRLDDDDPETRIGYLLLMLDEADTFIDSCKENNYKPITAFKNLPEGRFKLVMAGLRDLSNFTRSVLCNNSVLPHLEAIVVKPFKRAEGTELLTHTLSYLGFRFDPGVIQLILAKTHYFPGLIQLYCQRLLETLQNDNYAGYNEIDTPPYNISEQHIKKVLSDKNFTKQIDNRLWMTLTVDESEGSFYMAIALILAWLCFEQPEIKSRFRADIQSAADKLKVTRIVGLDDAQLEEILLEMVDLNILTADETPDGKRYMFSSEGFRDLLGSREKVKADLADYREEGDEQ
ncbi:MAG: hypothetical protein IKN17_05590 [Ruminococcus sp.]|nr:hypothetical protein [Ruminococcus sp.]